MSYLREDNRGHQNERLGGGKRERILGRSAEPPALDRSVIGRSALEEVMRRANVGEQLAERYNRYEHLFFRIGGTHT